MQEKYTVVQNYDGIAISQLIVGSHTGIRYTQLGKTSKNCKECLP